MKNRKILSIALIVLTLMMCFLTACGNSGDDSNEPDISSDIVSEEPSTDENPFQIIVPSKEPTPSTKPIIIQPSIVPSEEPSIEPPSIEEVPSVVPVCDCELECIKDDKKEDCPICAENIANCQGVERDPLDLLALPSGQTTSVKIISFGNNTPGNAILNAAKKGNRYDFTYMYEKLKSTINSYDVKIINQSSIFTFDANDYSGDYDAYISPTAVGDALVNAGFNVIAHASKNAYIEGKNGINNTLNFWQQYPGVLKIGIQATQSAYDSIPLADVNGIRIAFLNYTATLNETNLTSSERYLIRTLSDENVVAAEIKEATRIADFVIVLPSWGLGTVEKPTANQKKWVKIFADNGADLIIGSGVSSIQPVELIVSESGQIVPCYYSLGNCVAGATSLNEIVGGAATIEIQKTGKVTTIQEYDFLPTFTHISTKGDYYQTYMLTDYVYARLDYFHYFQKHGNPFVSDDIEDQIEDGIEIKDISKMTNNSGLQVVNPNEPDYITFNPEPSKVPETPLTPVTESSSEPSTTSSTQPSSGLPGINIT